MWFGVVEGNSAVQQVLEVPEVGLVGWVQGWLELVGTEGWGVGLLGR